MKIDFSRDGFTKATPKVIIYLYIGIMALSGLWMYVVQPNFTDMTEHLQLLIMKIIGSLNSGIIFFCQFAHYKTDTNETS